MNEPTPANGAATSITVSPSFWARYGTETVIIILLCLTLVGLPLLLVTLFRYQKNKRTKLIVDRQRTTLLTGFLSTSEVQVRHKDVRSVMLNQGVWDRMFGVHRIRISSSGTGDSEIDVSGIPKASEIKELIHQFND
jgi:uncharacterized membrane protein YdbT with pleckstrin-like domain